MKKIIRSTVFLIIPLLLFFWFYGCNRRAEKKVCFKNSCIRAEVVATRELRRRGLMFRESLAPDRGMLFVYKEEGRHAIWMKNMRFSLDIIWIDRDKKIVDIYRNATPCKDACNTINPSMPSNFVLEVGAGFVDKNQLRLGDKLNF